MCVSMCVTLRVSLPQATTWEVMMRRRTAKWLVSCMSVQTDEIMWHCLSGFSCNASSMQIGVVPESEIYSDEVLIKGIGRGGGDCAKDAIAVKA